MHPAISGAFNFAAKVYHVSKASIKAAAVHFKKKWRQDKPDESQPFLMAAYTPGSSDRYAKDRIDDQHEHIFETLKDDQSPVVSVTGVAGSGKTSMFRSFIVPKLRSEDVAVCYIENPSQPIERIYESLKRECRLTGDTSDIGMEITPASTIAYIKRAGARFRQCVIVLDHLENVWQGEVYAENSGERLREFLKAVSVLRKPHVTCVLIHRREDEENWSQFIDGIRFRPLSLKLPKKDAVYEYLKKKGIELPQIQKDSVLEYLELLSARRPGAGISPAMASMFGWARRQLPKELPKEALSSRVNPILTWAVISAVDQLQSDHLQRNAPQILCYLGVTECPMTSEEMSRDMNIAKDVLEQNLSDLQDLGLVRGYQAPGETGMTNWWECRYPGIRQVLKSASSTMTNGQEEIFKALLRQKAKRLKAWHIFGGVTLLAVVGLVSFLIWQQWVKNTAWHYLAELGRKRCTYDLLERNGHRVIEIMASQTNQNTDHDKSLEQLDWQHILWLNKHTPVVGLYIKECGITSFKGLGQLTSLERLDLLGVKTDILPELGRLKKLLWLDVSFDGKEDNEIELPELEQLPELRFLLVRGRKVRNHKALPNPEKLALLDLRYSNVQIDGNSAFKNLRWIGLAQELGDEFGRDDFRDDIQEIVSPGISPKVRFRKPPAIDVDIPIGDGKVRHGVWSKANKSFADMRRERSGKAEDVNMEMLQVER